MCLITGVATKKPSTVVAAQTTFLLVAELEFLLDREPRGAFGLTDIPKIMYVFSQDILEKNFDPKTCLIKMADH